MHFTAWKHAQKYLVWFYEVKWFQYSMKLPEAVAFIRAYLDTIWKTLIQNFYAVMYT